MAGNVKICDGYLLDQKVEVIVNAWNRNIIPWWLLLPQAFQARSNGKPVIPLSMSLRVTD
jgi:hypothetical protein